MSSDSLVQILILVAGLIVFCVFVLIAILVGMTIKERKKDKKEKQDYTKQVKKTPVLYTPESIIDFMNFEKIEDNMIIQKNGKFLMVVECHGINYDLMSEMEKASVEQGFIAFLNTLRFPIQLYIQTRTINLEKGIEKYKSKYEVIEGNYIEISKKYEKALKDSESTKEEIERAKYDLIKQKNLMEYTADIISDVERQSLNKNILSRKYYVIVPCYQSEMEAGDFDKNETRNMAFSELYTRSRAIINSLMACQVSGKILSSEELIELLYVAYNRDEADLFWMDKLKKTGIDDLYATAPDIMDKKLKILDKEIERKSTELANKAISEVRSEKEIEALELEKNQNEIINKKAKEMINKHKKYIGEEIASEAIDKLNGKIEEKQEKEEDNNGNVQEKGKKGRSRRNN